MIEPACYDAATHGWWVAVLGPLHDSDGPTGDHWLHRGTIDAYWPVGCYVAVEADKRVRYVGQVHRLRGGFDQRFMEHHQPVSEWHRVWLLPLRRDVAAHIVSLVEALLIWTLRPSANHVRPSPALRLRLP